MRKNSVHIISLHDKDNEMRMLPNNDRPKNYKPLKIFGVLFIIIGIYLSVQAFGIYKEQLQQRSWQETEATITHVSTRQVSRGGAKGKGTKTVYDAVYVYENDLGKSYVGEIEGTQLKKTVGEKLTIKYDLENPSESTNILEPSLGAFSVNLFFGLFWVAAGIFPFVKSKISSKSKKKTEKETVYSKKDFSELGYPYKLCLWAVLDEVKLHRHGIPLIVGLCFVLFGVLAKTYYIFYIAGGLGIAVYVLKGVVQPVLEIDKHYKHLGSDRFYAALNRGLENRKIGMTPYVAAMEGLRDEM